MQNSNCPAEQGPALREKLEIGYRPRGPNGPEGNWKFRQKAAGYVALSSILVISVVILTIGISVSLLSISESQLSLAGKKKEETVDFVEGCVEDALLELNNGGSISSSLTLPEGTCSVTIDSQSGSDWTFTVTGSVDNYTKSIQVSANRGSTVTITSWKEVE